MESIGALHPEKEFQICIPAPREGDTWPHKSAMGLINRMLSRLFPLIRGKQTSSSHANPRPMERTHLTPYPNSELKHP
jgi:hypothetical protein